MTLEHVEDLRSVAPFDFEAAQAPQTGVHTLFGPDVAFGSAAFAERDARELAPSALHPPPQAIPGRLATGSLGPGERFVVRIPRNWNGRLVVAGTPAQRSEFACDRLFSDPLLLRGFAYACANKGLGDGAALLDRDVHLRVGAAILPRFRLPGGRGVSFRQHAPGQRIEGWSADFSAITRLAQELLADVHGRRPELIYAVGLSNGGYQVRRAIEESDEFAGALTWNAVLWTRDHNALRILPEAIAAMEAGEPQRVAALGFPPDVPSASGASSLYRKNLIAYWYVTAWLHAMHLDPEASLAYGDVTSPECADAWNGRMASWRFDRSPRIAERVADFANTGRIRCKLIELGAEYDHLIPPAVHLEPYRRLVCESGRSHLYRSAVLPNAQHVDAWSEDPEYPQMRIAQPRVMAAFDELVRWVEGS